MRKKLLLIAFLAASTLAYAQRTVTGTTYYLPKTALRLSLLIEKAEYTPGQFAMYANKYMKKSNIGLESSTTYRIVKIGITAVGMPDTKKEFTLDLEKKVSVSEISRDESGILLAINTPGRSIVAPQAFVPSPKRSLLNPKDYMNEDILSAGSVAKMAELTAKDIYDIRESRASLSRGQADYMPKDGAQLRIMMENLDAQEHALLQTFEGVTTKDTTETIINVVPTEEGQLLAFRFSNKLGLVDADDLAGTPYYINITADETPTTDTAAEETKEAKDNFGLCVNIPVKIHAVLTAQGRELQRLDTYAGQFGKVEYLSTELFGKKQTSKITLNPVTGSIEKIESELLK